MKGGLKMDEQIYSIPVLQNEVQNLKERVAILEDEAKQDRKEFTQVTKTISENLSRLAAIQEQQAKQLEDMSSNIDSLRDEMANNMRWYQGIFGKIVIAITIIALVGWGVKGVSEITKLIKL
jgi:predicted RNase H-like nuclease (RuvC/YqgF family)